MSRSGPQKGFTLLEALVVISIIAILSGMAAVAISEYQRRNAVKEAARSLDGDLAEIRAAARMRQEAVLVQFPNNTGYTACLDADSSNTCTAADTLVLSRIFSGPVQLQGVAPFVLPNALTYSNLGFINATTQITVSLTTGPNRQYRVTIFSTGSTRVEMSEDSGGTWARAW